MSLAFVRYFLAVVESGGFTAAAERCHVTQPTLSSGIARLEAEIGGRLFERGRKVALSPAGRRFLPHARSLIESWQAARAEQRLAGRPKLVRIAVGSTLPIAKCLQWIAAAQRTAGFDLELSDAPRARCDLALYGTRAAPPVERAAVLFREPYLLASAGDHLVATRDRWSVRDLAETPFVLRAACEAHEEASRLFAAEGVRPRAILRSADEERCAAAVLAGLGVSLMPRCLLRPGMASASLREVTLDRRVVLAWREGIDPALVEALRDTATGRADERLAYAR